MGFISIITGSAPLHLLDQHGVRSIYANARGDWRWEIPRRYRSEERRTQRTSSFWGNGATLAFCSEYSALFEYDRTVNSLLINPPDSSFKQGGHSPRSLLRRPPKKCTLRVNMYSGRTRARESTSELLASAVQRKHPNPNKESKRT